MHLVHDVRQAVHGLSQHGGRPADDVHPHLGKHDDNVGADGYVGVAGGRGGGERVREWGWRALLERGVRVG